MNDESSVTDWIRELKQGNDEAAQKLWRRFVRRVVALAHDRLGASGRRQVDASDIAQEAFAAFFRAAKRGTFARLEDREDMWQLLMLLTQRKITDRWRRAHAARRPRLVGESALGRLGKSRQAGLDGLPGYEADPAFVVEAIKLFDHLMGLLDPRLQELAKLKMQGFTNQEIAQRLGCVAVTVSRRLNLIRKTWQQALE